MAKKDFAWKIENVIGEVEVHDREKRIVAFCSLDKEIDGETEEVWYVAITTLKFFKKKGSAKEGWHIVKNATFPLETWNEIVELVGENLDYEEE
jgi:hypothetical protein